MRSSNLGSNRRLESLQSPWAKERLLAECGPAEKKLRMRHGGCSLQVWGMGCWRAVRCAVPLAWFEVGVTAAGFWLHQWLAAHPT